MTAMSSLRAVGLLAERMVREAGGALDRQVLLDRLADRDVGPEEGAAAVRLSTVVIGRLEATTDDKGRPVLRIPDDRKEATPA